MIFSVAGRECRTAVSARWLWFYVSAAALLGSGIPLAAAAAIPEGVPPAAAEGRILTTAVSLLALAVPWLGLTLGTQSLAGERDRRTLDWLLAQPITRSEVLIGKMAGNSLILAAVITAFTISLTAGTMVLNLSPPAADLPAVAGLAWLLAVSSMALGFFLAAGPVGIAAAQGTTLFAWLWLILFGDLAAIGLQVAARLSPPTLLAIVFLNPVHQFRAAAMASFSPNLEMLGPAGAYASHRLGEAIVIVLAAAMAGWTAAAALGAWERFRRSPIVSGRRF